MAQSRDDDESRRPRQPNEHVARKLDAAGSERLLQIVERALIIESDEGRGRRLSSLLRALLGRRIEVRHVLEVQVASAIATALPRLLLWPLLHNEVSQAVARIRELRSLSFVGAIVVVIDRADARDVAALRNAGVSAIIVEDDLDSVRLALTLEGAAAITMPPEAR